MLLSSTLQYTLALSLSLFLRLLSFRVYAYKKAVYVTCVLYSWNVCEPVNINCINYSDCRTCNTFAYYRHIKYAYICTAHICRKLCYWIQIRWIHAYFEDIIIIWCWFFCLFWFTLFVFLRSVWIMVGNDDQWSIDAHTIRTYYVNMKNKYTNFIRQKNHFWLLYPIGCFRVRARKIEWYMIIATLNMNINFILFLHTSIQYQ